MALTFRTAAWLSAMVVVACLEGGCATTGPGPAGLPRPSASRADQRREAGRLRQAGQFDKAIDKYRSLLSQPSEDAAVDASLRQELSYAYWSRGALRGDAADRQAAIEQVRHAMVTLEAQSGGDYGTQLASVGRSLGRYLRGNGQVDEAVGVYRRLLGRSGLSAISRAQLLHELGNAYLDRGMQGGAAVGENLSAALASQTEALAVAGDAPDCPIRLKLSIRNSLGLIQGARMHLDEAAEQLEAAMFLAEKTEDHMLQAEVLGNLILSLVEAGRYGDARSRAESLEKIPGALTTLRPLAALGMAAHALGDYTKAREYFDLARFLADQDAGRDAGPSFIAQLAVGAASAAQALGAYEEAERYLLEAERKLADGGVDPRTSAVVKANLGRMYLTLERLNEAEAQLEAVHAVLEAQAGPQHSDTLLLLLDLADLSRLRGHLTEARTRCQAALAGLEAVRGARHPDVARARLDLASLHRDEGMCADALAQAQEALAVLDEQLGVDHKQSVIACLQTTLIAADCSATAEGAEAFASLHAEAARRYAQLRADLGSDNVEVLRATVYFADVGAQTPAAYAQALQRYQEAEAGFLKRYGDGVLSMAALRLKQGKLLEKMGRSEDAFRVYDRARRLLDRGLSAHPIHAELLSAMGDLCRANGDDDRAKPLWQEAYRILSTTYGSDHPRVRAFMETRAP